MLIEAPLAAPADGLFRPTPRATAAAAVVILSIAMLAGTSLRLALSPVQELAKAELSLSDVRVGLVQGLAIAVPGALLSLPIGRLTDRANRVMMLAILGLASTIGAALTAVAQDFTTLFIARMLAGIFSVCALPVAISFIADIAGPDRRGRALLLLQAGAMSGTATAFALGGGLVGHLDATAFPLVGVLTPWRQVQLLFAFLAFVSLLPLAFLREPPRHEVSTDIALSLRAAVSGLWQRRRFIVPLFIGQLTVVMADTAAGLWAAPVLTREYGLQPGDFAGWMGLVLLFSALAGATIGGLAADFGQKGRIPGGILGGAIVAAVLAIPAAFFAVSPSVPLFAAGLSLLLLCGTATGIITATAIAVYIPNELRGFCLGMFIVVGAIGGLGIAPSLVPVVSAMLGGEHHVGAALAIMSAATSVVALIGFASATRHMPRRPG